MNAPAILFRPDLVDPDFDTDAGQRLALDLTLRALRGMTIKRRRPLQVVTISLAQARAFIGHTHRHAKRLHAWKFGCGLQDDVGLVGACAVGRPRAIPLDDGATLEVYRLALLDGLGGNAGSMLLGRAKRAAAALGYTKLITYTLDGDDPDEQETGAVCIAAGFEAVARTRGGSRNRPSRARTDGAPTCPKIRWECAL